MEKGILVPLASCVTLLPRMVLLTQEQHPVGPCQRAPVDAGRAPHLSSRGAVQAVGRRGASGLELAARKGVQLWDFSSSLFLSPVNRCSGSSGGGHAAQLHGAGSDNLGDTRRNYPVCQTDLCGDAGGTVCNKGGKVHRKKTQLAPQQRWELWSVSLVPFTTRCRTTLISWYLRLKPTQCVFPTVVRCF